MDPAEPDIPAPAHRPGGAWGALGPSGDGHDDGHQPGPNGDAPGRAAGAEAPGEPPEYTCPGCSVTFAVPVEPADRVLECPACHTQFFVPAADDDWRDDRDEADEDPDADDPAAQFDSGRIEKVKAVRRGLYRTRSYVMVGVYGLSSIAFVLAFYAAGHAVFGTFGAKSVGYVCAAVGCVIGAVMLRRRTYDIDRELAETALPEPEGEPDLSTLGDGSQYLDDMHRRLERMGRGRRDDPPTPEEQKDEADGGARRE
jgi:hypothetical protein